MKILSTLLIFVCISSNIACAEQGLIIYKINGEVPVILVDDYGFMLINNGNEKNPIPRYIFANRETAKITDTKNIEKFKETLSKLPNGTIVTEYVSCTMPRWWGLTEDQKQIFFSTFKEYSLEISADVRVTCYCSK